MTLPHESIARRGRLLAASLAVMCVCAARADDAGSAPGTTFRDCPECPQMAAVPPGSFRMGSNENRSEQPVHVVRIPKSFAIGTTEVTQGQWRAVMGNNPSVFRGCGEHCPVEGVNWDEAREFATRLSRKTGRIYRLPSEAEWEYACRAGGSHAWCGGDDVASVAWYEGRESHSDSGDDGYLDVLALFKPWRLPYFQKLPDFGAGPRGRLGTHPAARKQPNAWGLYDMSGNVWEWTEDCESGNYDDAPADGRARISGKCGWRMLRGGAWSGSPQTVRAAVRHADNAIARYGDYGLRVVRELP